MREYNRKLHELQNERSYSRQLERQNKILQRDSDTLQTIRDEIGNDAVDEILDRAQQRAEEEAELYEQERASRSNEWDLSL